MLAALKLGQVMKLFTGGNAVVWPERYRQVGYYYEEEQDVFKLKPRGSPNKYVGTHVSGGGGTTSGREEGVGGGRDVT